MATEQPCFKISLIAAADLSAKQFQAVKVDSAGKAALAGLGDLIVGILQNKPASGEVAEIVVLGITKWLTASVIAPGAKITADANGKAVTAVTGKVDTSDGGAAADPVIGSNVSGVALNTANSASGDLITALLLHEGAVPTTNA